MSIIATFDCEVVTKEFQLVGQCITVNFPSAFPEAAIRIQKEFWQRRSEIHDAVNPNIIFSPYMCNGAVATYFACLEVSAIGEVPEGMIGFKLPVSRYAKINCSNRTIGEAYTKVFEWIGANGYKQRSGYEASPVEIFYIEDQDEEKAEILIPIE